MHHCLINIYFYSTSPLLNRDIPNVQFDLSTLLHLSFPKLNFTFISADFCSDEYTFILENLDSSLREILVGVNDLELLVAIWIKLALIEGKCFYASKTNRYGLYRARSPVQNSISPQFKGFTFTGFATFICFERFSALHTSKVPITPILYRVFKRHTPALTSLFPLGVPNYDHTLD